MSRVGILGGAFDPPHIGHLILAQSALNELDLEGVLFVPCGVAPHGKNPVVDPQVRLEMCELAISGNDRFSTSSYEVEKQSPSYTVEMLQILSKQRPGSQLFLILGADQALNFASWRLPEEIAALALLAVARRSGIGDEEITDALTPFGSDRFALFTMPEIAVSSSYVRDLIAAGQSVRYLLPDAVETLISDKRLYG